VTFDTKAGLTRVGFTKRTRNLKPRFSHASNVVLPRSHVYTRSKQSLGGAATLFSGLSPGILLRPWVFLDEINPRCQSRR
jgi:hypothetical protein